MINCRNMTSRKKFSLPERRYINEVRNAISVWNFPSYKVGSSEWYNNVCEPGHKILDLHLLLLHLVTWISCSRITSGMHTIVWEPSLAAEDEGKFYYQARSYLSNLRENIGYSYQRYRWTKTTTLGLITEKLSMRFFILPGPRTYRVAPAYDAPSLTPS